MEKLSAEYPSAIVREGGLGALLNYLPFFSTNVQRTAVTAAANCCRNIAAEQIDKVRDVFPILRDTLGQSDQRLVEQATLALIRTVESYRHNASHLESLLDVQTVTAVNAELMPAGGSPLISPSTYTHLLKALTSAAKGSPQVTLAFLKAGMSGTIYQILTGVMPPNHDQDEQGASADGQGLAGGIADMVVLQNLAHRPKEHIEEALALLCELLPPTPRDGVFDPKAYGEKALHRLRKGRKSSHVPPSDRVTRHSSRTSLADLDTPNASAPTTPLLAEPTVPAPEQSEQTTTPSIPAGAREALLKAKEEAEEQARQRLELLQSHPDLMGRFIRMTTPILVDVYAASVSPRVRTKVLAALVKAVAFASSEILRQTLMVRLASEWVSC